MSGQNVFLPTVTKIYFYRLRSRLIKLLVVVKQQLCNSTLLSVWDLHFTTANPKTDHCLVPWSNRPTLRDLSLVFCPSRPLRTLSLPIRNLDSMDSWDIKGPHSAQRHNAHSWSFKIRATVLCCTLCGDRESQNHLWVSPCGKIVCSRNSYRLQPRAPLLRLINVIFLINVLTAVRRLIKRSLFQNVCTNLNRT